MCIICVSKSGIPQPSEQTIRTMFQHNPHGAGYMVARDGAVEIRKGFMNLDEYIHAIRDEHFTRKDSVVYHFRISTQAGVTPQMTHPFPLAHKLQHMNALDINCPCGIAHNGIIRLTSTDDQNYSDTALFITGYLSNMLHSKADLRDQELLDRVYALARSKFAIMDNTGYVATVGDFYPEHNGLLYSNLSYLPHAYR